MHRLQTFLLIRWLNLTGRIALFAAVATGGLHALAAPPQLVEVLRFTGTTLGDEGTSETYPPDTMGALGGGNYVELLNSSYALYSSDTGNLSMFIPRMTLKDFWDNAFLNTHNDNPTGGEPPPLNVADNPFDPRIFYDSNQGRWYAISVDYRESTDSRIYVAVTTGDNPSPPAWRGFVIDADQKKTRWADFPTLGASKDGVFVTATMIPIDPMVTTGTQVHLAGVPLASLKMPTPTIGGMRKVEDVGFTGALQMAVDTRPTQPSGTAYRGYVSENLGVVSSVEVPTDFFSGGALVTSSAGFGAMAPQGTIPYHPSQGSLVPIEAGSTPRYTSNVVLAWSGYWGVRSVAGPSNQLQWFRADPATGTVIESRTIGDPNGEVHFFYPSIHASAFGEVVIGFNGMDNTSVTGKSANAPGSWAVAGVTDANGVTTFGTPKPLEGSASTYDVSFLTDPNMPPDPIKNPYRNRWGDYSATTAGRYLTEFATIQEYAPKQDVWATTVSRIMVHSDNDSYFGPVPGIYGSDQSQEFGKSEGTDDTFSVQNMRFTGKFDASNMPDDLTGDGDMKVEQYDWLMSAELQINDDIFIVDDSLVLAQQKFTLVRSDEGIAEFRTELVQFDIELTGLPDLPYDLRFRLDDDRSSLGYLNLIETEAGMLNKSYFDLYTMLEIDRDRDGTFEEALPAMMSSHQILRAVPEPPTSALLILGVGAVLLWHRGRVHQRELQGPVAAC